MPKPDYVIDWFKSLGVKGDYSGATLDGYFLRVDERLKDDMVFLRNPIRKWRGRSGWLRVIAFGLLALGVLLPLPVFRIEGEGPSGLELGYFAVLLGGLVLFADQVFAISSSWMRLTLAEMEMSQLRYRLELEWARRRPLLTKENEATEGPGLIDVLKAALDNAHDVMQTQKVNWTTEIRQGMEALRTRLNDDRIALEKLRTEQRQEQARPKTGAVNISIDKPADLKGPLVVKVGDEAKLKLDTVPAKLSLNNIQSGLQTLHLTASRVGDQKAFEYLVTEEIVAGEVKSLSIAVG